MSKPPSKNSPGISDRHSTAGGLSVNRLYDPIDIGLIAFFRIAFGALMLYELSRFVRNDWISSLFIEPRLHFTYYGFSWVRPWAGDGMYWHFTALAILAGMILVGLFYRLAAILFCLGMTYVFLLDQALYLNHMYLICLISFLAIFLPANRKWSVDARLRPAIRSDTAPAWTLWLLRFQVGIAYSFGAIAKLDEDWFNGRAMGLMLDDKPDFPIIGQYFGETWMIMLFVWGGFLFDLLIVPALLWSKTRTPAYVACIVFHATNNHLFRIGVFPLFMITMTLLFFPADSLATNDEPEEPHAKRKRRKSANPTTPRCTGSLTAGRRIIAAAVAIYVTFQITMPLRHWLYPSHVNWSEEGHRFSWHMKLRIKISEIEFLASTKSGDPIDLAQFNDTLTAKQAKSMAGRPDMILQYAHFLANALRQDGHEDVAIHVLSRVSLNGREPQPLIDPDINLARVKRSIRHADWVLPMQR